MKKDNMRISVSVLALSAGLLALTACQKEEPAAPEVVRPVLSEVVKPVVSEQSRFAGTVQPKVQTALGFRVGGLLVARDVDTGDVVTMGQQLAALDPTSLELAVRSARADLANAEATLANAQSVEQRTRALFKTGTQTQAAVESTEQTRQAAQSSVVQAQSALQKAEEQLSYTRITASFDGVVTATSAEVGQVVAAGASVVTLARPDERDAVVDVPDTEPLFAVGTPFIVSLQVDPTLQIQGKVREIAPALDAATRSRRVKIALENPPASFRLGTTITAALKGSAVETIVLPASAVLARDGKSFVWIVNEADGTVSRREITIGPQNGSSLTVTSGIEAGVRVVTAGVNSLEEGQKVKVEGGNR